MHSSYRSLKSCLPLVACACLSLTVQPPVGAQQTQKLKVVMPKIHRATASQSLLDTLQFGNAASEQAHSLTATLSEIIMGGINEPARRLLPQDPPTWEGGKLAFTLKVDPRNPNYVTARFWGSDVSPNRLILFCEGKQTGYHHLGDVDQLDFGTDSESPGFNGRFFYNTSPFPPAMTQGKAELHFEVRCIGPIWGYGSSFAQYQKTLVQPTRGIYCFYTHTDGYFVPPAAEKQGAVPANPPIRKTPGLEMLDKVKARVNGEIDGLLTRKEPLNQMQMQFIAKAYHVHWTHAYQNNQVVAQVVKGLDHLFQQYRQNPKLAEAEPSTYNPDWFGLGPAGDTARLLAEPLQPLLDAKISIAKIAPDGKSSDGKSARRKLMPGKLMMGKSMKRKTVTLN